MARISLIIFFKFHKLFCLISLNKPGADKTKLLLRLLLNITNLGDEKQEFLYIQPGTFTCMSFSKQSVHSKFKTKVIVTTFLKLYITGEKKSQMGKIHHIN